MEVPSVEVSPGHTQGLRVGRVPRAQLGCWGLTSFLDTHCSQTPVHHCGFQTEQCGLSGHSTDLHPQVPLLAACQAQVSDAAGSESAVKTPHKLETPGCLCIEAGGQLPCRLFVWSVPLSALTPLAIVHRTRGTDLPLSLSSRCPNKIQPLLPRIQGHQDTGALPRARPLGERAGSRRPRLSVLVRPASPHCPPAHLHSGHWPWSPPEC